MGANNGWTTYSLAEEYSVPPDYVTKKNEIKTLETRGKAAAIVALTNTRQLQVEEHPPATLNEGVIARKKAAHNCT